MTFSMISLDNPRDISLDTGLSLDSVIWLYLKEACSAHEIVHGPGYISTKIAAILTGAILTLAYIQQKMIDKACIKDGFVFFFDTIFVKDNDNTINFRK